MDYQFPQQLFPSFYNSGPPASVISHCAGTWGSYDRVRPQGGSGPPPSWTFTSRHQTRGEVWRHTEPVTLPLLSPKNSVLWPLTPPDPLHFTEHMQNFFKDNYQDTFECMGEILAGNFTFRRGTKERYLKDSVYVGKPKTFLDKVNFNICSKTYSTVRLNGYNSLLSDVVSAVPPELLGSLLYEELTVQRERMLFSEGATGGAMAFVPFSKSSRSSQCGCLIYPRNKGMDCLNFHRVELQHHRGSSCVDASSDPISFQLKAPVRQISAAPLLNDCCVAVRSDYLCGVWRFSETNAPRLLQVINTQEIATCVSASPHVLGEVLVASESGAANLWTVGRGMQKVRKEDGNLYFNVNSSWRWCEFSAHPRVMLYADKTGVELTDIRKSPISTHTLFRISNTPECRSGERLVLSRYLGDIHPFHHLITTQYSAYIMDERFPCVPMLKLDHMMESPPMFCHTVCGSASSAVGGAKTSKVLLGSHNSQEITLLQYTGGRAEACSSRGPPQALLRPKDSLEHLPVQIPHRLNIATSRLSSPAAGLACIQTGGGGAAGGEECLCVLQLTEAGDIFYQILEPEQPHISGPPAGDDQTLSQPAPKETTTSERKTAKRLQPHSQAIVSDTSSDEGVIGPTQTPAMQRFVPETPERESNMSSDSEGSEPRKKSHSLRHLPVVVNSDAEQDQVNGAVTSEGKDNSDCTEEPASVPISRLGHVGTVEHQVPLKLSDGALVTWKRWLQKLVKKNRAEKLHEKHTQYFKVKTEDLLKRSDERANYSAEEERVQSLRQNLRAYMSRRSLLVHSAVSASLGVQDVVAVPDPVDTDAWSDQISQRLTVSWQGEDAWRAWWEEHLGLNMEAKVEALKTKRRRQKEARRASGKSLELSCSFTSSVSQSELSDVADFMGWSSAASQEALSESEGKPSQPLESSQEHGTRRATAPTTMQTDTPVASPTTKPPSGKDKVDEQKTPSSSCSLTLPETPKQEHGTPRATAPTTMQTDTPVASPTSKPSSGKDKVDEQQTPSSSRSLTLTLPETPKPSFTPASQRRSKRPAEDYLSSLFASQDEPSEHDGYFLRHAAPSSSLHHLTPAGALSSYQLRSSQSFSQRSPRKDPSQESSVGSGFSQSQSLSQRSQGRPGLSQTSQQKKKKSRMGF